MGKDNKFERLDAIKDRAISLVESQINGDVANVDANELGEIADIAKDMAETKKLCMEAKYYEAITDAMEESDSETKQMYMNKYLPEMKEFYGGRYPMKPIYPIMYYRGGRGRMRDSRGRFMYTDEMMPFDYGYDEWDYDPIVNPHYNDDHLMPMYQREYKTDDKYYGGNRMQDHDPKEGRSWMRRKMYMDMKEHGDENSQHEELEGFMRDLSDDITEMIENSSPQDKTLMRQRLTQLIGKIQ